MCLHLLLCLHLHRHMGRSFSCSQCKFTTAREQNLREHMKNHNKECFACPICHEKFSQKKNLTRHLVRHSTKLPKLSCNECNFTTLRKDKLTAHMYMKHQHMGRSPQICTITKMGWQIQIVVYH